MAVANDKMALASVSVSRGETHVSPAHLDASRYPHISRTRGETSHISFEHDYARMSYHCHMAPM